MLELSVSRLINTNGVLEVKSETEIALELLEIEKVVAQAKAALLQGMSANTSLESFRFWGGLPTEDQGFQHELRQLCELNKVRKKVRKAAPLFDDESTQLAALPHFLGSIQAPFKPQDTETITIPATTTKQCPDVHGKQKLKKEHNTMKRPLHQQHTLNNAALTIGNEKIINPDDKTMTRHKLQRNMTLK